MNESARAWVIGPGTLAVLFIGVCAYAGSFEIAQLEPLGVATSVSQRILNRAFECVAIWCIACIAVMGRHALRKIRPAYDAAIWPLWLTPMIAFGAAALAAGWAAWRYLDDRWKTGVGWVSKVEIGIAAAMPLLPLLTGAIACAVLYKVAAMWRRARPECCTGCGRELMENTGACPDCGTTPPVEERAGRAESGRRGQRGRLAAWVSRIAFACAAVTLALAVPTMWYAIACGKVEIADAAVVLYNYRSPQRNVIDNELAGFAVEYPHITQVQVVPRSYGWYSRWRTALGAPDVHYRDDGTVAYAQLPLWAPAAAFLVVGVMSAFIAQRRLRAELERAAIAGGDGIGWIGQIVRWARDLVGGGSFALAGVLMVLAVMTVCARMTIDLTPGGAVTISSGRLVKITDSGSARYSDNPAVNSDPPATLGNRAAMASGFGGLSTAILELSVFGKSGVSVPLWVCAAVAGIAGFLLCRRRRPPRIGHCRRCGYNLTGNTSGVCPECGSAVVRDAVATTGNRR